MSTVVPLARRSRYPLRCRLEGLEELVVRPMTAADEEALVAFARSLAPEDLLCLSEDARQPAVIGQWRDDVASARRLVLVAERAGAIVGSALLSRRYLTWMRHLGQVRVVVAASLRGQGLGALLTDELVTAAKTMGLTKLVAEIPRSRSVSSRTFRRVGFGIEALLTDWVLDEDGRSHDLLVLSRDLAAPPRPARRQRFAPPPPRAVGLASASASRQAATAEAHEPHSAED